MTKQKVAPARLAIVTPTLSHFEAPLYRLLSDLPEMDLRVFHRDPLERNRFDSGHNAYIDWGRDVSEGFAQTQCMGAPGLLHTALWDWAPDVILLYGYSWPGALEVLARAKLRGIPVVHRGTISHLNDPRRGLAGAMLRALRPAVLRLFDAHHFGGDFSRKALSEAGVRSDRCYFVPYSVDSPVFLEMAESAEDQAGARALRTEWGWSATDFVVLFLSQHTWVKGADLVVPAMAALQSFAPNAKLVMAGSGALTDTCRREAERCLAAGSFAFPGFVPSYSTVPYYLASTVVIYPSRYETWARGVNEAMICERPCLVTDMVAASGGLVADGENGLVVAAGDTTEMARRLAGLAQLTRDQRAEMGRAARERALAFSYEANLGNAVRSILDRLC